MTTSRAQFRNYNFQNWRGKYHLSSTSNLMTPPLPQVMKCWLQACEPPKASRVLHPLNKATSRKRCGTHGSSSLPFLNVNCPHAVHQVLYLLFTEGHISSLSELAIRQELCKEATRLATILADHPEGQTAEIYPLLSLMHFLKNSSRRKFVERRLDCQGSRKAYGDLSRFDLSKKCKCLDGYL